MSIIENTVIMQKKDNSGNQKLMYPVTRLDNIIILDNYSPSGNDDIVTKQYSDSLPIISTKMITGKSYSYYETITLPFNYVVGSNKLWFFLNGEKLIPGYSDTDDDLCHYKEVGTIGSVSSQVELISDWEVEESDVLEFILIGPSSVIVS